MWFIFSVCACLSPHMSFLTDTLNCLQPRSFDLCLYTSNLNIDKAVLGTAYIPGERREFMWFTTLSRQQCEIIVINPENAYESPIKRSSLNDISRNYRWLFVQIIDPLFFRFFFSQVRYINALHRLFSLPCALTPCMKLLS